MQYLLLWLVVTISCSMGHAHRPEILPKGDQTCDIGDSLNLTCKVVQNCNINGEMHFYYKHRDLDYHQKYRIMQVDNCTLKLFVHRMEKAGMQFFHCNTSISEHRTKTVRVFDPFIGNVSCEVSSDGSTTTMSCGGWCYKGKPDPGTTWRGTIRYDTNPLEDITDCNVNLPFNGCGIYSFYLKKTYITKTADNTQDVNISISQVKVKVSRLRVEMQTPSSVLVSWDPPVVNVTDNCPTPTPHHWLSYTTASPGGDDGVLNVTEYLHDEESFNITNISPNTTLYIEMRTSFGRHTRGGPQTLVYTTTLPVDAVPKTSTPTKKPLDILSEGQIIAILCGTLAAVTGLFVTSYLVRRWYKRNKPVITTPPPLMYEVNGEQGPMSVQSQNSDYTMLPYDTQLETSEEGSGNHPRAVVE